MPDRDELLKETYRLAKENNAMLHKMRRSAFVGRLATIIFYAAFLLAPIWFYLTYLNGTVQQLLSAYQKMQSRGAQVGGEYQQIQQAISQFQSQLQAAGASSSSATAR